MKKISKIIGVLFMVFPSCLFQHNEKNLNYSLYNLSISTCDQSVLKSIYIYKNDLLIGNLKALEGKDKFYLGKHNEGYLPNTIVKFNQKNQKYLIQFPKGDLVYEVEVFTNKFGKIDSMASLNFCK